MNINSPIGKSNPSVSNPRRVLTVEDMNSPEGRLQSALKHQTQNQTTFRATDPFDVPQDEKIDPSQILQEKKKIIQNKDRLSSTDKTKLETLLNIGRSTKDVEIDGTTFTIKTLKGKEHKFAWNYAITEQKNALDEKFILKDATVALCIDKIDGVDFEILLEDDSPQSKLWFVENLEDHVIDFLYQSYAELDSTSRKRISTPEDVKDIVEQIKK